MPFHVGPESAAMVSGSATLTIAAGTTVSTGIVTINAVDNDDCTDLWGDVTV